MFVNVTILEDKIKQKIDYLVGKPYGFSQRLRMGRIGSKKMEIVDYSIAFHDYFSYTQDLDYGNIEIRPLGIIIRFRFLTESHAWIIPFYKLSFFKHQKGLSFHADGHYLCFKDPYKHNRPFIDKIMQMKVDYDEAHKMPPY